MGYKLFSVKNIKIFVSLLFVLFNIFIVNQAVSQPVPARAVQSIIPQIDPARAEERIQQEFQAKKRRVVLPEFLPVEKRKPLQPEQPGKKIKFKLNSIVVFNSSVYSSQELKSLYKLYLGKEVTFADIKNIANAITRKYRADGYILSRAIIPAQKVTKGIVRIQVIEGYIAEVKIEGKITQNAKETIQKFLNKIAIEKPLRLKSLERYILLVNDLAGIEMKSVLYPAKGLPGATGILFKVKQGRIDGLVEYNNYGTRYLGPQQLAVNASFHNIFGTVDNIGLYFVKTTAKNDLNFAGLFYERPLNSNGLEATAELQRTRTNPGFLLEKLDLDGYSDSVGIGVRYPFIRSRQKNFSMGLRFRALDSKTEFQRTNLFLDKIRTLDLYGNFNFTDSWQGINNFYFDIYRGLPVLNASRKSDKDPQSRADGNSTYTRLLAEVSRLQVFDDRLSAFVAAKGQYARTPLLSADEFGFGGVLWGRGFDPSELIGDKGVAAKAELRFNTFPDLSFLKIVQIFGFYDYGVVWNIGSESFQPPKMSASSTGLGLRIRFTRHIAGSVVIAKPMTNKVLNQVLAGKDGQAARGFFNIFVTL